MIYKNYSIADLPANPGKELPVCNCLQATGTCIFVKYLGSQFFGTTQLSVSLDGLEFNALVRNAISGDLLPGASHVQGKYPVHCHSWVY